MNQYLHENNLEKISQFDNAMFYCINESSKKIPVGFVKNFTFLADSKLEFTLTNLPLFEHNWNVFGAELFFYKKGLSFNLNVHGTAWFVNQDELTVQFKILLIETFGTPEVKPYSLHDSVMDFLSNTGIFFKKMLVSGF